MQADFRVRESLIGLALLASAGMFGCDQTISEPPEGTIKTVEVVYNDNITEVVDLEDLDIAERDGEDFALLSDVVHAAHLGVELEALEFDFEASDEFRSSSTSTCVDTIPMEGALLRLGYIHRITRNLDWDVEPELPACVGRLRDMSRIHAMDRDDDPPQSGP